MNIIKKSAIALLIILAAPLALACDYPSKPANLPDGTSATKEEMLAAVKTIQKYQEVMTAYLSCIEANAVVSGQAIDPEDKAAKKQHDEMVTKKYNAAVDEQTLVVEEFNAQIRAFKAQSK